jgi:hypothetical protein
VCLPPALNTARAKLFLVYLKQSGAGKMTPSVPDYVSPIQWQQAIAVSRQECARIFRDGGMPGDALAAFGMKADDAITWERAVDQIAAEICARPVMRAA